MSAAPPTMPELIEAGAAADPGRVALCVNGTEQLTIGEWFARSRLVAAGLAARGARPGKRVAALFAEGDWIGYAIAAAGVYLSGATLVGLSSRLAPQEVSQRLSHCRVSGVLRAPGLTVHAFKGWRMTLDAAGQAAPRELIPPGPGDLAELIHTSGTTAGAKAVAVPHSNLTFGQSTGGRLPGAPASVLAPVLPGTNAGHSAILVALLGQSTVHVLSEPSPTHVGSALSGLGIGMVILPAPLATRLAAGGPWDGGDLASVRTVMLGSAPVPGAVIQRLRKLLPAAAFSVGYGSTEAAPASTHQAGVDGTEPAGSLGHPRPGAQVQIRAENGQTLGEGEVGQIWLRSPAPARGYYRYDDGTFRDGWVRMGDLGFLDTDGGLRFFDRAADAIHIDGHRVSAFRVEDALHWHPAVADACVVHVPGKGEGRLVAAVELAKPVKPQRLIAFAAERLDAHEVPAEIVTMTLPRGDLGKPLKRRLRESLA